MKINNQSVTRLILLFLSLSTATLVSAAPLRATPQTAAEEQSPEAASADEAWVEKPWYIFGGFDLGLSNFSAYNGDQVNDASRSGVNFGFRGLLAHYWKDWMADAGLGWAMLNNSGNDTSGRTLKVVTRLGYFDFSPRYRMTRNWQIGPELEYWLSSDDGSNPSVFTHDSNSSIFAGLQLVYEWQGNTKYRLGGRWLTGLNIPGRTANTFQVFFQIGLTSMGSNEEEEVPRAHVSEQVSQGDLDRADYVAPSDPLPLATPEPPMAEPDPVVSGLPKEEPVVLPQQKKVILTLDVNDLPFGFDSAKLPSKNQGKVRSLGKFLNDNKNSWKQLIVSGHTDERGSNAYNDKLSKSRAATVRSLLIAGGAPANRIKAVGYGKRKPRDRNHNEKAWAKNRRVELEFRGVKDIVIIRDALQGKK